ncbi:uncharacterized protein LOC128215658 [Mya arenaria]|uniref:uncharacterized protein LOC128215658 n=1 Tax=Mya arenaria TaxID=6604 RepID=UPI0022E260A1|nr:uncharacterized protein LOC128215658 [Mya arenaria]
MILTRIIQLECAPTEPPPICCLPKQYEAFLFLSSGAVDVGTNYGFGYSNGTVAIAFDGTRQLTYIHAKTDNFLSLYPIPIPEDYLNIIDYKNNVQWRVYSDGSCDTLDVGLPLFKECIPGNATLLSRGRIGNSEQEVATYLFRQRIYLDPDEITVTVRMSDSTPGECIPVRGTVSSAYVFDSNKNVDIAVYDVLDFTPGIRNPDVFNKPSQCNNSTVLHEKNRLTMT